MQDAFYREISLFDKNKKYGKGDLVISFNARIPDQTIIGTSMPSSLRLRIDIRTYPKGACTYGTAGVYIRTENCFIHLVVERDEQESLLFSRTFGKNGWELVIGNERLPIDYSGAHSLNMLLAEYTHAFQKVFKSSTQTEDVA